MRAQLQRAAPHAFRQPAKAAPARSEPRKAASAASPRAAKKAVGAGGADAAPDWEEF